MVHLLWVMFIHVGESVFCVVVLLPKDEKRKVCLGGKKTKWMISVQLLAK